MNNQPPCASCVDKFIFENGRKPYKNELEQMNRAKPGCECAPCYRESCYKTTNTPMPPDYPTFDEAYKDVFAR